MPTKRSYEDGCAAAHALDLVGERWGLLVVRELLLGPKRFTDLRTGLPGISPNILAQRLEDLEQAAVIQRRKLPPPAGAWVYELTEWGMELEPVIMDLGRWGARSPARPQGASLSVDALVLSFLTMFDPDAAGDLEARYELRFGDDWFHAEVAAGQLTLARGRAERPHAVVEGDANTLAALVYGGRPLADALRAGDLRIVGDASAVGRFFGLFPLPEPAPARATAP
jgi:DNA-binding HxlR family transcriptional regulator